MNKKGFTLMELLLVVAILAIVAAAAAPTFTSGAGDALKEARKSAFLGAYQNTVTGAHMMVAIAAAKGYDATTAMDLEITAIDQKIATLTLEYYSPKSTRQFKNNAGEQYYCGAQVDNNHNLFINFYKDGATSKSKINMQKSGKTSTEVLDNAWDACNGGTLWE